MQRNIIGTSYGSQIQFKTLPDSPILTSPANHAYLDSNNTKLIWEPVTNINSYRVQVSVSSTFNSLIINQKLSNTNISLSELTIGSTYYWRVCALTNTDSSDWSDKWKFTVTDTQKLNLTYGWNLISSYIEPKQTLMDSIWQNNLNNVTIVKDNGGNAYIPEFEINQIGDWVNTQGYQAYINQSCSLNIIGARIKPEDTPINLPSGWNIIGYLRNSSQNIEISLSSLVNAGALVIAKNNEGQVYIPEYGINDIGDMLPGQGYQIYLSEGSILTYPANTFGRSSVNTKRPKPKYLKVDFENTGNNAVILFVIKNALNYSEIGVYSNNGKLIGSGTVYNGIAAVTVWG